MWRELISSVCSGCTFFPPTNTESIASVEGDLRVNFPPDLKALLLETNGVFDNEFRFIWSLSTIKETNLDMRSNPIFVDTYEPFDNILFFSDANNGDYFAFSIMEGTIRQPDIYVWDHEDDRRRWIAPSIRNFLIGWLTSTISV